MAKFLAIDFQADFSKPSDGYLPIPYTPEQIAKLSRLCRNFGPMVTGSSLHLLPELAPLFWERIINVPRLTYTPQPWPPHAIQGTDPNELNG